MIHVCLNPFVLQWTQSEEPDGSKHARHASEAVVHLRLLCVTSPSVHVHLQSNTLSFCVSGGVTWSGRSAVFSTNDMCYLPIKLIIIS